MTTCRAGVLAIRGCSKLQSESTGFLLVTRLLIHKHTLNREDQMTFQELQNKIGERNEADWSVHANGGGWVHKNARVDASTFIDTNAIIFSGRVYGNVRRCKGARRCVGVRRCVG